MAGQPQHNFPLFNSVAAMLRYDGHHVVNPVEVNGGVVDRVTCLRNDFRAMLECDTIYLLPGWEDSMGALCELHIARELKFNVRLHPGAEAPVGKFTFEWLSVR